MNNVAGIVTHSLYFRGNSSWKSWITVYDSKKARQCSIDNSTNETVCNYKLSFEEIMFDEVVSKKKKI